MNIDLELALAQERLHAHIDCRIAALLDGTEPPLYVMPPFASATMPPPTPRRRGPNRNIASTLSDLLDNIASTLDTITKPLGYCGIEHDTRIGLRRLGPHVIPREADIAYDPTKAMNAADLSGMMFIALPASDTERTEDRAPASFYYAVKINRAPQHVEPIHDAAAVFEFGYCADFIKRTQWDSAYVVVKKDSSIHVCRQLFRFPHHTRSGTYYEKRSDVPLHNIVGKLERPLSPDERRIEIAKDFAYLVAAWRERYKMWSVSVRRSGNRATFCVPMKQTKDYFKNRDKTALTPSGKRRPIFHHVREFERTLPDGRTVTVKEHVRGLRTFDWNGYACAITAPKFHKWTTQSFNLSSIIEEDARDNERHLFGSKIGGMLAEMEDKQQPLSR